VPAIGLEAAKALSPGQRHKSEVSEVEGEEARQGRRTPLTFVPGSREHPVNADSACQSRCASQLDDDRPERHDTPARLVLGVLVLHSGGEQSVPYSE